MRKKLRKVYVLLSFCLIATPVFGSLSDHLLALKSRFPYGLLGDDYGILTINDLALNACHFKPEPFAPGALNPYEYWICFESKTVLPICEDRNFSNEDGHVGRVAVEAQDHRIAYSFIEPRPWRIRECRSFVRNLKKLMKGTSHACISASYIGDDEDDGPGKKERMGILNRFKTPKGCDGEECAFTDKVRQEYCPDLKS